MITGAQGGASLSEGVAGDQTGASLSEVVSGSPGHDKDTSIRVSLGAHAVSEMRSFRDREPEKCPAVALGGPHLRQVSGLVQHVAIQEAGQENQGRKP